MPQPASRRGAAAGASSRCGGRSSFARVPIGAGSPRVWMFSLMVIGTPSSGESGLPARQRASAARACSSAFTLSTRYIALSFGSQASMRAKRSRVASTGEISPRAYAAERAAAESGITAIHYTARTSAKKNHSAFAAQLVAAQCPGRGRGSPPARGRGLAWRRAGEAARALQRLATRGARRRRLQRRGAGGGARRAPARRRAPRPAVQREPGALLQPRRAAPRRPRPGAAEDLVRDGAGDRRAGGRRASVRLRHCVAGAHPARERRRLARGFARRVRQRHGALGGDARFVAAFGLLQLCAGERGCRATLRRRPVRVPDHLAFTSGRVALARRLRSWRRAAAALRGLCRRAAGRRGRLAAAGKIEARIPCSGAAARVAGATRSASRVARKDRRCATCPGRLRPAGAAPDRRRGARGGVGGRENRARRAQRRRAARQRADQQIEGGSALEATAHELLAVVALQFLQRGALVARLHPFLLLLLRGRRLLLFLRVG